MQRSESPKHLHLVLKSYIQGRCMLMTTKDKVRPTFRIKPDFRKEEVQRAAEALKRLDEKFPDAGCSLNYNNPFQMLVAAVLLTQSDERSVNRVTGRLFETYPTPEVMMEANRGDIETIIRSTGFYRQKAKYLTETARILVEKFDGQVPDNLLEITQLPGVARKVGNLIMGELFGKTEGIQVDTQIHRVVGRLELSNGKITSKVEHDLMRTIEQEDWPQAPYLFSAVATHYCYPNRPACHACPLKDICPSAT